MDLSTEVATGRLLGEKSTDEMELVWFVNMLRKRWPMIYNYARHSKELDRIVLVCSMSL